MSVRVPHQFFVLLFCLFPFFSSAQTGGVIPIASTVAVLEVMQAEGEVVVYNKDNETYAVSLRPNDERVFGVTAIAPALVFETSSGTIPVVERGVTRVRVNAEGGQIEKGDILVTSSKKGEAMKMQKENTAGVFAVALESLTTSSGIILVEVNKEKAEALVQETTANGQSSEVVVEETSEKTFPETQTIVRGTIAALIALCGLGFVLYSFRSTIAKAVVSIGRNPRARGSIMLLSFGNVFFALVLCAVALFVAIAVLVLPV